MLASLSQHFSMPGIWRRAARTLLRSARTFAALKQRGVLVKHVAALHPLLANCLRLTVGTPTENDALIAALKESL